jgi:hypothetical protein
VHTLFDEYVAATLSHSLSESHTVKVEHSRLLRSVGVAISNSLLEQLGEIAEHSLFDVVVCSLLTYSTPAVQTWIGVQTRSENLVGEASSNSVSKSHALMSAHNRSRVALGTAVSYCESEHTVHGTQIRSEKAVGLAFSYSFALHFVNGKHGDSGCVSLPSFENVSPIEQSHRSPVHPSTQEQV